MCTVTIAPIKNNGFVLTSNRDEAPDRISLVPEVYKINETRLLFPKDVLSGGTWIGVSDKNRLICVLNGGYEWHERKETYRLSRGIVAQDFLLHADINDIMNSYDLSDIEPFTMVIVDWNTSLKFFELVWDGVKKHISYLPLEPKIWSSSTLYDSKKRSKRRDWFNSFTVKYDLDAESLMNFHKTAGKNNDDYGVIMDRKYVKTTSITQVEKNADFLKMRYENLDSKKVTHSQFNQSEIVND